MCFGSERVAPLTSVRSADDARTSVRPPEIITAERIEWLAQCLHLTHLDVGVSMPGSSLPKQPQSQADRASTRSCGGATTLASAPFRRLGLGVSPLIGPEALQLLSECTELEEIRGRWSALSADWMRLAHFPAPESDHQRHT